MCSPADLTKEPVWRGVARRLAQWHATLPIVTARDTASVQDADAEIPLSSSAPPRLLPSLEEINAITPNLPIPNVWTIMQKWVFALPTSDETEKERKELLQKELEHTVSELGDTRGLRGNGVCTAFSLSRTCEIVANTLL